MILRFIPDNYDVYLASRIILCIDIIFWFIKILNTYSILKIAGPKLIMINKMLIELISFITIILIIMFAFGVSTQSLMYHNVPLNANLLKNVFSHAFFIIVGEFQTRSSIMDGNIFWKHRTILKNIIWHFYFLENCVPNDNRSVTDRYDPSDCPDLYGANVTLIIYMLYIIFLNMLFLNLLIGVFGYWFFIFILKFEG
jgi:hypothetical protein